MRVAKFVVAAVGTAFAAALLIRPANLATKLHVYYRAMKADLEHLALAQEEFRADSARYAGSLAELGDSRYATSSGISVVITLANDSVWSATARNSYDSSYSCRIAVSSTERDPLAKKAAPICTPELSQRKWRWAWNY